MAGGCDDYWRETSVAGVPVRYCRCGTGSPVVILHHDIGCPERMDFAGALSGAHDVVLPVHPGFGLGSERAEWMRSVRDLAVLYRGLLAGLGIERASLVGLGFGGWVAAEMASMAPMDVDRLVLVGAMGIQPREGFILDQALIGYIDYAEAFFKDPAAFDAVYGREPTTDQLEAWDICREMCFRIAWKPYMYSQTWGRCWAASPRRRWWCGARRTRWCRRTARTNTPPPCRMPAWKPSRIAATPSRWSARRRWRGSFWTSSGSNGRCTSRISPSSPWPLTRRTRAWSSARRR